MKNLTIPYALGFAAAIGLGYYVMHRTPPPAGISSPAVEAPAALPANMPRLEDSDGYAREKAASLSPDPAYRTWLWADSALPRLVAAINMAAHGKVPREILAPFAPAGKFAVLKKDGKTVVDPASYKRYDKVAAMIKSVDAVAAAKVFEGLLPLLDAAQRALGEPNTSAKEALFVATRELLSAPAPTGDAVLVQRKVGIGWNYADARLENLSPAQKQVLRLGPENQLAFQAKLRAIALALGATGLPQP